MSTSLARAPVVMAMFSTPQRGCHGAFRDTFVTQASSSRRAASRRPVGVQGIGAAERARRDPRRAPRARDEDPLAAVRSEEHTSELQSPDHLVCRLLLEKKKTIIN